MSTWISASIAHPYHIPNVGNCQKNFDTTSIECAAYHKIITIYLISCFQSTLLSTLTHTHSEAANYEFTTLTCIPGVIEYKGANIQLLDLPGIIEGAAQGKGRGRQVSLSS